MDNTLILKDSPFIDALLDWGKFRISMLEVEEDNQNGADRLSVDRAELAKIVNQCFCSSIKSEEGRVVKGTICISSPEEAPHLSRTFEKAVPVSVKALVSLLIASPESPLGIQNGQNGPEIWGFLDSVPYNALILRITALGTIVSSFNSDVIAVLQCEKVYCLRTADEYEPLDTDAQALKRFVAGTLDSACPFPDAMKQAQHLLRIVAKIYRHGHGGALVLVPDTNSWDKHIHFGYKFNDSSTFALQERSQSFDTINSDVAQIKSSQMKGEDINNASLLLKEAQKDNHRALLDSTLCSIGDLSAIDGALVMDNTMKVLGFGAKLLNTCVEEFSVIIYDALENSDQDVEKKRVLSTELGGTRHQSAARFVYENRDTIVFVASQDGRLTLFLRDQDNSSTDSGAGVMAVCNLEYFIWDYHQ